MPVSGSGLYKNYIGPIYLENAVRSISGGSVPCRQRVLEGIHIPIGSLNRVLPTYRFHMRFGQDLEAPESIHGHGMCCFPDS